MTGFLAVTNWARYQHYRDRQPTWIKYHVEILHDEKLKALPLSTRLLWDQMLLLAAMFQNAVPNSPELIGNLVGIAPELCREGIEELVKGRWLREKQTRRSASKSATSDRRQRKKTEEEAEQSAALAEMSLDDLGKTLEARASPFGSEERLFEVLPDMDRNSPKVLRRLLELLPPSSIEYARAEVVAREPRKPTGYAVEVLTRMVEKRRSEVVQ